MGTAAATTGPPAAGPGRQGVRFYVFYVESISIFICGFYLRAAAKMICASLVEGDVRCWNSGSQAAFVQLGHVNAFCKSSSRPLRQPAARSTANSDWRDSRNRAPPSMNMIRRRDLVFSSVAALILIANFSSLQTLPAFSQSQRFESTVVGHRALFLGTGCLGFRLQPQRTRAEPAFGSKSVQHSTGKKTVILGLVPQPILKNHGTR